MALPSNPTTNSPSAGATTTAAAPITSAAATASHRIPSNPPPPARPPAPPLSQSQSLYHHNNHHHHHTTYPLHTQSLPNLAPRAPSPSIHPHPQGGIIYPVASSGRGFLQKSAARPQSADQAVTIANPGGYPAPAARAVGASAYAHSLPGRAFGFPQSDHQVQVRAVPLIRPSHLPHTLLSSTGGAMSAMVKGVSVSAYQKAVPSLASAPDGNGYKDPRDKSRDENFVTVRDRKVRLSEGSSLYAACRSWLRSGFPEENQPHYMDDVKSLPKPSPPPIPDAHSPAKKDGDKEEEAEEEGSVEHLSPADLLHRHVKRAKRVRARLREERLQRIARYKTRLALLLPPLIEQHQFRNDLAAGN